eukprot:1190122-Prorocentrum_minimum.AAC.1
MAAIKLSSTRSTPHTARLLSRTCAAHQANQSRPDSEYRGTEACLWVRGEQMPDSECRETDASLQPLNGCGGNRG